MEQKTQSRAIARAWVEAKSPRNREELQRDEDAVLLYQMKYELHGPVYPDYSVVENRRICMSPFESRSMSVMRFNAIFGD